MWYRQRRKPKPKQRTSVGSRLTPALPELEGIFREYWSDPLGGGGKPKVSGKSGQIQDQKLDVLTPAQGTFHFISWLSTWRPGLSYQEQKGEDCDLSIFPSPMTLRIHLVKSITKPRYLLTAALTQEWKHIWPTITELLLHVWLSAKPREWRWLQTGSLLCTVWCWPPPGGAQLLTILFKIWRLWLHLHFSIFRRMDLSP